MIQQGVDSQSCQWPDALPLYMDSAMDNDASRCKANGTPLQFASDCVSCLCQLPVYAIFLPGKDACQRII